MVNHTGLCRILISTRLLNPIIRYYLLRLAIISTVTTSLGLTHRPPWIAFSSSV